MQTAKNKFKNIKNEHLKSTHKTTNFVLCMKQPENLCRELASYRFIKVIKDAKYVKIISMKPINV